MEEDRYANGKLVTFGEYASEVEASIVKGVLAVIRSFPEIVLALMFIKAVGPGSAAGVFALGFHSVGMLAKLFSEAIENLEDGPNEAVTSVGGSKFNIIMFSTMPNLMPAQFHLVFSLPYFKGKFNRGQQIGQYSEQHRKNTTTRRR